MTLFAWSCLAVAGVFLTLGLFAAKRATRPVPAEFDARVIRMVAVARCPSCGLLVSLGANGRREAHIDPYSGLDCGGAL